MTLNNSMLSSVIAFITKVNVVIDIHYLSISMLLPTIGEVNKNE